MSNPVPQSDLALPLVMSKLRSNSSPLTMEREGHLRPMWTISVLAWLVRVSALINLVSSLLPTKPSFIYWMASWAPFEISDGIRVRMFLTSLLLFILASGLAKGKRTAWLLTMATLAIAPVVHWGQVDIWPQALINLGLIVFLLLYHRYFVVQSDQRSIRSALLVCSLLATALLIIGTVRLHDLRHETSGGDDWGACIQTALELVLVQNAHTQAPQTSASSNFFVILRVGGISIALVGLFLTLRPVLEQRRIRIEDRDKVKRLIEQYGRDPFDSYALLNDKSYVFTSNNQAVVPYVLSGNIAVALADPIGNSSMHPSAIVDFALFCRSQDWEPVFYAVTSDLAPSYVQAGFSLFKIGEGARLRPAEFYLKGREFQNLRTLCNNAHKLGVQFRWYDPASGIDEVLENQMTIISQRWLKAKKAREMCFDMGEFLMDDIRERGAAVAVDAKGNALAFATWRSFAQGSGRALDLMRTLPHARNIMDFVLVESIAHFRANGVTDVSLGLAPLANTKNAGTKLVAEEKVVQFLFENLNHIYGYKSLFEFKRKYRPHWRGRYVAYHRGVHLPLVGLALVRVHAPSGFTSFLLR